MPSEISATAFIARDTGEYYVVGDKKYPAPKARVEAVPADSWGKKEFRYCRISLNYEAIQKLEAPVVKGRQGFSDTREYHFNVKFRIRCGNSLNMPYGDNNWLELKTKDIGPTGLGHAKVTWP